MDKLRVLPLILCPLLAVAAMAQMPSPTPRVFMPEMRIAPGDNLRVIISEDASLDGDYQVRRGGYIIIPAVGRVKVEGMIPMAAELEVSKAVEATQLSRATVIIRKVEGRDVESVDTQADVQNAVFIDGAVMRPGFQAFPPGGTLGAYEAILDAGGFGRFADFKKIYILRKNQDGSKSRIPVPANNIRNGRAKDVALRPMDVLVVPEKFFSF